jgi:predicted aspartyl protease
MIRYSYTAFTSIPAPFVHVTLRCRETGMEVAAVPALIDTGADCTVLPARLVGELSLVPMGRLLIEGLGGRVSEMPTYAVEVAIRNLRQVIVKVLAADGEPVVLLGRDVLNHFRILLDGPGLAVEVSES